MVFQAAEVVLKPIHDLKPQAEALPDPLIPSPIDLRQSAYFPVDLTHPSFGELVLIKSDAVFRAVVSLISWSITRVPAGCFPADMVPRLSRVAAPSERWWKRRQAEVLSHFVLCSDGNYYHRELSKHIIDLAEKMKPRSIRNLGDATPAEWVKLRLRVFERDEFKCQYCGDQALDCDHVIAVADGGPTVESNLVAACFRCNRSKGKKPLSAWLLL